jgi:hypothetical protein
MGKAAQIQVLILVLLVSCAVPKLRMLPGVQYQQAILIKKPHRTQYGYKLTLLNNSGDTLVRYVTYKNPEWQVGNCYMVIK